MSCSNLQQTTGLGSLVSVAMSALRRQGVKEPNAEASSRIPQLDQFDSLIVRSRTAPRQKPSASDASTDPLTEASPPRVFRLRSGGRDVDLGPPHPRRVKGHKTSPRFGPVDWLPTPERQDKFFARAENWRRGTFWRVARRDEPGTDFVTTIPMVILILFA